MDSENSLKIRNVIYNYIETRGAVENACRDCDLYDACLDKMFALCSVFDGVVKDSRKYHFKRKKR